MFRISWNLIILISHQYFKLKEYNSLFVANNTSYQHYLPNGSLGFASRLVPRPVKWRRHFFKEEWWSFCPQDWNKRKNENILIIIRRRGSSCTVFSYNRYIVSWFVECRIFKIWNIISWLFFIAYTFRTIWHFCWSQVNQRYCRIPGNLIWIVSFFSSWYTFKPFK